MRAVLPHASRRLARADVVQLDVGADHRDGVAELRPLARAIGEQVLARAPALIDVDAPGIKQVGGQCEVHASWRLAGVLEDRYARVEVRLALRRVEVDRAGDDDRHGPPTLGWWACRRRTTARG